MLTDNDIKKLSTALKKEFANKPEHNELREDFRRLENKVDVIGDDVGDLKLLRGELGIVKLDMSELKNDVSELKTDFRHLLTSVDNMAASLSKYHQEVVVLNHRVTKVEKKIGMR